MPLRFPLFIALLALSASACSKTSATPEPPAAAPSAVVAAPVAPAVAHAVGDTMPRLVFFMNPYGGPCQMQDRILHEMAPELNGRAMVVYYRTTEQADLPQFSMYAIRALPTLVVTDSTGRELRRATPGIHSAEEIRQLLAIP